MIEERNQIKLTPPWITYVHKLEALFSGDPQISLVYNNDDVTLKIFVGEDEEKADALMKLLPLEKEFGNVTLKITVVPPNNKLTARIDLFRKAFKNNTNVDEIYTVDDIPGMILTNPIHYIIFKKEVVQFFNDDLADAHGNETTLNEIIAREVFGTADSEGVFFCTNNVETNTNS